ncbi:MAG: hypothetical protein KTR33_01180 [Gammaproteobacteria bacterium]|nr:hypothetical protein [Gammaproteobacteria bacterium]
MIVAAQQLAASDDDRYSRCLAEIDIASGTYFEGDSDKAGRQLNQLLHSCDQIPQLHHNLGVLAAEQQDWSQATGYFEQALALDRRAAMTQASLSAIYQYKAGLAYQKALKLSQTPDLPQFAMQDSTLTNVCLAADTRVVPTPAPDQAQPQNATQVQARDTGAALDEIRYDINSWWAAIREQDNDGYQAYYADGYTPPLKVEQRQFPAAEPHSLDIQLLDKIALVTVGLSATAETSESGNGEASQELLLVMQHKGKLWQIIKEQAVRPLSVSTGQ